MPVACALTGTHRDCLIVEPEIHRRALYLEVKSFPLTFRNSVRTENYHHDEYVDDLYQEIAEIK